MNKYEPLKAFFEAQEGAELTVTFEEIEKILGLGLPKSAYEHSAWWSNARTDHHSWPQYWMRAGWFRTTLNLEEKTVRFEKKSALLDETESGSSGYWWVNHKQTHRAEIEGGYVWSPKAKQNGRANKTYDNLRVVEPADIVFSYADGAIRAIGTALSTYREQQKPEEFGSSGAGWHADGWLVPVEWILLDTPVRPKDHMPKLVGRLPSRHSPLQDNGNGNQGVYLASIPASLAKVLLDLSGSGDEVSRLKVETANAVAEELEVAALLEDDSIEPAFKDQLIRARVGQGRFRAKVAKVERRCRLTGVDDPRFLVASHIKPWAKCSNQEKLDAYNGLFLAPHVDRLFDRGWISFENDGTLLTSGPDVRKVLESWGLAANYQPSPFNKQQQSYLAHHRDKVYGRRITQTTNDQIYDDDL